MKSSNKLASGQIKPSSGMVNVADYGADPTGAIISTDIIQSVINNNIGKVILIGSNLTETYTYDKTIQIPSGSIIRQDGKLTFTNGVARMITEDMTASQNFVKLDNVAGLRVGKRLIISANNQPINGGGAWKTRKVGLTGVIQSISGNTVTFTNNISNWLIAPPTIATGGRAGQYDAAYNIENVQNVIISGKGIIDGNVANNYNVAGANYGRIQEDFAGACGIVIHGSTNVFVQGLTIKNQILHGISTGYNGIKSYNVKIDGVTFDGNIDKATCFLDLVDSSLTNFKSINGVDEGDICVYSGNANLIISNGFCQNNRRYGVGIIGVFNSGIIINNIQVKDNIQAGVYVQNQINVTSISNITASSNNIVSPVAILNVNTSANVNIQNLNIFNCNTTSYGLSIGAGTGTIPKSKAINVDGLSIKTFNKTGSVAINIGDSQDCNITGFSIDGCANALADVTGNTNIQFLNGRIENFTALNPTPLINFRFSNVVGSVLFENSSVATIPTTAVKSIVTHEMSLTPKTEDIKIEPINSLGNVTKWWISNINSSNFTINVDVAPTTNTAKFRWNIETYKGKVTSEAVYTVGYASDFSVDADGVIGTRVTPTGNVDGVSDGTTSLDNVLQLQATAVSGTHEFSKVMVTVGKQNRITLKYFIPTGQTTVNGFRMFANSYGLTLLKIESGQEFWQTGKWVEFTTPYFVPTVTTMIFRMYAGGLSSFTGDLASDKIYFKDVVVEYLP